VSAVDLISSYVDKIVCQNIRSGPFFGVADAYKRSFDLTDKEVLDILGSSQGFG
jgi:predicted phosphoribosyltransferase